MPPKSFEDAQNNIDTVHVPDTPTPETPPKAETSVPKLKTIRTYASDMAEAVQEKQGSIVKIAVAEHERQRQEEANTNPRTPKNIAWTFGAIILIGGAIGALYFGVIARKAPVVVTPVENNKSSLSIITGDQEVSLTSFDKNGFEKGMQSLITGTYPLGSLTILAPEPITGATTAENFITSEGIHVSPQLMRSLVAQFSLGVYTFDGNIPFLVMRADSYDAAYSGLLFAEKTLYGDMETLFALPHSTEEGIVYADKPFLDAIIANKDVRVVKNTVGETLFVYGVLDNGTIIMTTSDDTFKKLIDESR